MGSTPPKKGHATRPRVGAALLPLAASAVLLLGCGSDSGTDQTSAAPSGASGAKAVKAVTIRDYIYKPATIAVPKGTTVTFTNQDSTAHTATSKESGVFESGPIETGKSARVTLDTSGTFTYYCLFHPFMKGTIVVE
ncbi:MAG TPA: cupredoxin domain-containing protein [Solirubrobacterales bacterium]|nr:cupredoxin domain-containing protein [Solirubrobacterales bacterium]